MKQKFKPEKEKETNILTTKDNTVTVTELYTWLWASWQPRPKGKHGELYNTNERKHTNASREKTFVSASKFSTTHLSLNKN